MLLANVLSGGLCQAAPPQVGTTSQTLVVFVHAADCKVCQQVRPVIDEIEKEYKDRAAFLRLDVTSNQTKQLARKSAKAAGVGFFLSNYEDSFPAVGVFNERRKLQKELYGLNTKDDYKAAIDKVLNKASSK